jgi:outer membrane biosynthesis protein TonB
MSISARGPYDMDRESSTSRWVLIFILLSLLAHALLIAIVLLVSIFMPTPKFHPLAPSQPSVNLVLQAPPPALPRPKQVFIPTPPDPNAKPKMQPIISANDTDLHSKSTKARTPDSIMPDVTGQEHHSDLRNSPNVKAPPTPEVSSTPPTPKKTQPEKPTPPQPKTPPAKQPTPQPQKAVKPKPPTPPKKEPQLDENGLPILPPINAATMAQVDPSLASPPPSPSQPQQAASVHGRLGSAGDTTPAAMATALGKYKQKVYAAVGSRWYPKVDPAFSTIGVGMVHVQFTIYSDGRVQTKVLDSGNGSMQTLLAISVNSIREAAPYDPFPPAMIKELQQLGGDGSSYTDDFTFSVY